MDFVCFSLNNWEKRKARKQQFMLHLSKREDVGRVLYIEPPLNLFRLLLFPFSELRTLENRNRWGRALTLRTEKLADKLLLFTPVFFIPFSYRAQWIYNLNLFISLFAVKSKIKSLGFGNEIILWVYHPFDYKLLDWFKNRKLAIFDWAEKWGEYFIEFKTEKKKFIGELEKKIIKEVDIVFTVTQKLRDEASLNNPNSYWLCDGTDFDSFQRSGQPAPGELENIKKPVLGYLGTVTERFCVEWVAFAAEKLSDVSFVIIGDVHEHRVDTQALKKCKNIYFLGARDYDTLGVYCEYFDGFILPYNPIPTKHIFPTKIFDYFSTGKPVAAKDLISLRKFQEYVYLAQSKEEFFEKIKEVLSENNARLPLRRKEIAQENTWEKRAEEIVNIIKDKLS